MSKTAHNKYTHAKPISMVNEWPISVSIHKHFTNITIFFFHIEKKTEISNALGRDEDGFIIHNKKKIIILLQLLLTDNLITNVHRC